MFHGNPAHVRMHAHRNLVAPPPWLARARAILPDPICCRARPWRESTPNAPPTTRRYVPEDGKGVIPFAMASGVDVVLQARRVDALVKLHPATCPPQTTPHHLTPSHQIRGGAIPRRAHDPHDFDTVMEEEPEGEAAAAGADAGELRALRTATASGGQRRGMTRGRAAHRAAAVEHHDEDESDGDDEQAVGAALADAPAATEAASEAAAAALRASTALRELRLPSVLRRTQPPMAGADYDSGVTPATIGHRIGTCDGTDVFDTFTSGSGGGAAVTARGGGQLGCHYEPGKKLTSSTQPHRWDDDSRPNDGEMSDVGRTRATFPQDVTFGARSRARRGVEQQQQQQRRAASDMGNHPFPFHANAREVHAGPGSTAGSLLSSVLEALGDEQSSVVGWTKPPPDDARSSVAVSQASYQAASAIRPVADELEAYEPSLREEAGARARVAHGGLESVPI